MEYKSPYGPRKTLRVFPVNMMYDVLDPSILGHLFGLFSIIPPCTPNLRGYVWWEEVKMGCLWEEGKMGCLWREVIVFMTAL